MTSTAIVIAIGNSDNRLTQQEWSAFWHEFHTEINYYAGMDGIQMHGTWVSDAVGPYQNAAWSLSWPDDRVHLTRGLKNDLREILAKYRQDSMAWTTGRTELVPSDPLGAPVRAITPGRWTCGCKVADCGPLHSIGITDGQPDPLLITRLTCSKHNLVTDSQPFLASLGDSEERRMAQALHHMDMAHQEQCR